MGKFLYKQLMLKVVMGSGTIRMVLYTVESELFLHMVIIA